MAAVMMDQAHQVLVAPLTMNQQDVKCLFILVQPELQMHQLFNEYTNLSFQNQELLTQVGMEEP